MMGNGREKGRILRDLEKSGYPSEIKATLIFEEKGWTILNQEGYFDVETGKWRTIDILALKHMKISNSPVYEKLHISVVAECKRSSKPWVFWIKDKKGLRTFDPIAASGLIKLESNPFIL